MDASNKWSVGWQVLGGKDVWKARRIGLGKVVFFCDFCSWLSMTCGGVPVFFCN